MTEKLPQTTLPVTTYRWRRWLSLALLIMCLLALFDGFASGCVKFSRVGVVDCMDTNPAGYWPTMGIIIVICISLFVWFLSSFGQESEEVHHAEDEKLKAWLDSVKAHREPLVQDARMPRTAFALLLGAALFSLWVLLAYDGFKDWVRFSLFAFLLVPFSLVVGMLAQWLGEKLEINEQGVRQFVILSGWKLWAWQDLTEVRMQGDYFEKNYQIALFASRRRLILKPSTFHQDKEKFLNASHWIVQEAMRHQVSIQLPPDGMDEWLGAIAEKD